MGSAKEFRDAIEYIKIKNRTPEEQYLSDMNNWVAVHATKYLPLVHKDGMQYIPTTAMATNFEKHPRNTVHFTLNHVVTSHGYGNWDATPYVILAPYKTVVELNKNPAQVSAHDTYWSVDPDKGLVLPKGTFIVRPSNDVLFSIGENVATYKTDNFTDEEIQQIEALMTPYDKGQYEKYKNADFEDYEIEDMLRFAPDIVKKTYASSKDKKAFLRGMYEETKFEFLTKYLRNAVVKMAMDKMGCRQIDFYDADDNSTVVAEIAENNGLDGAASNKGHSGSIYFAIEESYAGLNILFNGGIFNYGVYNSKDVDALYNDIVASQRLSYVNLLIDSIINNKPIDFYEVYVKRFEYEVGCRAENGWSKEYKSIAEFDENFDKTLRKNVELLSAKHMQWLAQIRQWPGYAEFIEKLKKLTSPVQIMDNGRDL